jgi:hypothetical protein
MHSLLSGLKKVPHSLFARESGGNARLMGREENMKLFPSLPTALGNRKCSDSHIPTARLRRDIE